MDTEFILTPNEKSLALEVKKNIQKDIEPMVSDALNFLERKYKIQNEDLPEKAVLSAMIHFAFKQAVSSNL